MRRVHRLSAAILAAAALGIVACAEVPSPGGGAPATAVAPEDRDTRVAQIALQAAGYNPGFRNGIMDAQTHEAIAAFQRDHGLPATGVLDRNTFEHLKSVSGVTTDEHGNGILKN